MKRILFAAMVALIPGVSMASAQVLPQRLANSDVENMRVEELQFLLDQRRQQLSQVNAELNALKRSAQETADYWAKYIKPADPAPVAAAPVEEKKQ